MPYIEGTPDAGKQHTSNDNGATRRLSRSTQVQAEATNIPWRMCTVQQRKYKFQACMGLQHGEHERLMRESERATTRITDADLQGEAATQEEAIVWQQLSPEIVHPDKRGIRRSSNNMQTAPTQDWLRNRPTTQQQILNPSRNKEHGILDKALETNIGSKQFRGNLFTLGIRADKV